MNENLKIVIKEKQNYIKNKTGNDVVFEINNNPDFDAEIGIDFGNWTDKTKLPKILYKSSIDTKDNVHILHELIHLENFFIDGYKIIGKLSEDAKIVEVEKTFKNIPENVLAHKTINDYGFNPIDEDWMKKNSQIDINLTDLKLAVRLVDFYFFSEFLPNYLKTAKGMLKEAKKVKPEAYTIAENAIGVLDKINYNDKLDYNSALAKIIKIFVPDPGYCDKIIPLLLIKKNGVWILRW